MPRSQLFEVDGLNPPQRISKLSSRYRCSIAAVKKNNMLQRVARLPSGRATVNQNHPVATAAAAHVVAAGKINEEKSPLLHLVNHPGPIWLHTPFALDPPIPRRVTLLNRDFFLLKWVF